MTQIDSNNPLIYVVDDDAAVARLVSSHLAARGYRVKEFSSGSQAISSFRNEQPDLIILDMIMPSPDGLEVTDLIRQVSGVPILILSALGETASKLAALDLGADDYLTKPFRLEELLARTRAILRRTARSADAETVSHPWSYNSGELFVDLEGLRVVSHGQAKRLTPREWAVLRVLVKYAGRVVSPRTLLQEAWGPDYGDEGDYVRAYVNRLRRKLEPDPQQPRYLLLERGIGYRLIEGP